MKPQPLWKTILSSLATAMAAGVVVLSILYWSDQGWFFGPKATTQEDQEDLIAARRGGLRTLLKAYPNIPCADNFYLLSQSQTLIVRTGSPQKDPQGGFTLPLSDTRENHRDFRLKGNSGPAAALFKDHPMLYPEEGHGWVCTMRLTNQNGVLDAQVLSSSPWGPDPDEFATICNQEPPPVAKSANPKRN